MSDTNIIDRNQNVVGGSIDTEASVLIDLNLDGNVDSGKMGIAEGASQLIFDMLTDISAKPGVYAIREAYSNAYDATKKTGDMSKPIEINIPDHSAQTVTVPGTDAFATRLAAAIGADKLLDDDSDTANVPMITITDHGCGMSADDLKSYFMMYGGSKKRGDYDMIGSKGLGCKAPIAVSPVFYVTTRQDGIECQATITRSDDGSSYNIIKSATDKGNGTTVSIPVLTDKILGDMTECVTTLIDCNYDANIIVNGIRKGIGKVFKNGMYDMGNVEVAQTSNGNPVSLHVFIPSHTIPLATVNGFVVVIGGYPYAVGDCDGFTTYYNDYVSHGYNTYRRSYGPGVNGMVFNVPVVIGEPGFLNFTPSRDEIKRDSAYDTFRNAVSSAIVNSDWTQPVIDFINTARDCYKSNANDTMHLNTFYNRLFNDGNHSRKFYATNGFESFDITGIGDTTYDCVCNGVNVTLPKSAIDVNGYCPMPAYNWAPSNHMLELNDDGTENLDYLNDGKPHVTAVTSIFNSGSRSRYRFTVNGTGLLRKKMDVTRTISRGTYKLPTIAQLGGLADHIAAHGTGTCYNSIWIVYGCDNDNFTRFFNRFADLEALASPSDQSRSVTLAAYNGPQSEELNAEADFIRAYSFDDVHVVSVDKLDEELTSARSERMACKNGGASSITNGVIAKRYIIGDGDYADLISNQDFNGIERDRDFDTDSLDNDAIESNLIILSDYDDCRGDVYTAAVISKLRPEYAADGVIVINGATKPFVSSMLTHNARIVIDNRRRVPKKVKSISEKLGITYTGIPSSVIPDSEFSKITGFLAQMYSSDTYGNNILGYDASTGEFSYVSRYTNTLDPHVYSIYDLLTSDTMKMIADSGAFPAFTSAFSQLSGEYHDTTNYDKHSALALTKGRMISIDFTNDKRVLNILREPIKPVADVFDLLYRNGLVNRASSSRYGQSNRKLPLTASAKKALSDMFVTFISEHASNQDIAAESDDDSNSSQSILVNLVA